MYSWETEEVGTIDLSGGNFYLFPPPPLPSGPGNHSLPSPSSGEPEEKRFGYAHDVKHPLSPHLFFSSPLYFFLASEFFGGLVLSFFKV